MPWEEFPVEQRWIHLQSDYGKNPTAKVLTDGKERNEREKKKYPSSHKHEGSLFF